LNGGTQKGENPRGEGKNLSAKLQQQGIPAKRGVGGVVEEKKKSYNRQDYQRGKKRGRLVVEKKKKRRPHLKLRDGFYTGEKKGTYEGEKGRALRENVNGDDFIANNLPGMKPKNEQKKFPLLLERLLGFSRGRKNLRNRIGRELRR